MVEYLKEPGSDVRQLPGKGGINRNRGERENRFGAGAAPYAMNDAGSHGRCSQRQPGTVFMLQLSIERLLVFQLRYQDKVRAI